MTHAPNAVPPPQPPSSGWPLWQVVLLGVVGVLVGMCFGVVLGARLADTSNGNPGDHVLEVTPSAPNQDEDVTANVGSAADPVPVGQGYLVGGGWTVRVVDVVEDAGDTVVAQSDLNVAPGANEAYVLITLKLEYDGPGAGQPQDLVLSLLDAEGKQYFGFEYSCGRIPNGLTSYAEVPDGTSITANTCFAVPTDQVPGMKLVVQVVNGPAVHYALR
jgi:hypothetical protein